MPQHTGEASHRAFLMGCRCDQCTVAYESFKAQYPHSEPFNGDAFMLSIRYSYELHLQERRDRITAHQAEIDTTLKKLGIRQ